MPTAVRKRYQNDPPRATRAKIGARTARADRDKRPSERLKPPDAPDDTLEYPTASDGLGKPILIVDFPDAFPVWLGNPMSARDLAHLESLCCGKLRVENRPFRNNPELRQRLILRQPSRAAIELLAGRNDVHFNGVELARDLIYATKAERDAAYRFHINHVLRKDRRGQQVEVCLGLDGSSTIYDAPRSAGTVGLAYPAKSKLTEHPHALHLEERENGTRALARKSIPHLRDVLHLDYVRFWGENLHYYRVTDIEGLGRAVSNYYERLENPTSLARRKADIIRIRTRTLYNRDKRMGHQLIRTLGAFRDDQIKISRAARKLGKRKEEMPGYIDFYAAISIQNLYDRLNHLVPMDRFISRISVNANSEISPYMRGSDINALNASAANAKVKRAYDAAVNRLMRKSPPSSVAQKPRAKKT